MPDSGSGANIDIAQDIDEDDEDSSSIEKGQKEAAEGGPSEKNSVSGARNDIENDDNDIRTPPIEENMSSSDNAGTTMF